MELVATMLSPRGDKKDKDGGGGANGGTTYDLGGFIVKNGEVVVSLASVISSEHHEDLAKSLLLVFEAHKMEQKLLRQLIKYDIMATKSTSTLFRESSVATTLLSQYCKKIGRKYLHHVVGPTIKEVCERNEQLEVDPSRVSDGQVRISQSKLMILARRLLHNIFISIPRLPGEIKSIINFGHTMGNLQFGTIRYEIVANIYFLRFICPALVSPERFGLVKEVGTHSRRTLILLSKLLQNLAFEVKAQEGNYKESYMYPLHYMLSESQEAMILFMDQLIHQTQEDMLSMSMTPRRRDNYCPDDDVKQALSVLHYHLFHKYGEIVEHLSNCKRGSRVMPANNVLHLLREELDNFQVHRKGKKRRDKKKDEDNARVQKSTTADLDTGKIFSSPSSRSIVAATKGAKSEDKDISPPPSPPLSPELLSPLNLSPLGSPILSPLDSPRESGTRNDSGDDSPRRHRPNSLDNVETPGVIPGLANSFHPPGLPALPADFHTNLEAYGKTPSERADGEELRDFVNRLQNELRELQLRLSEEIQLRQSLNSVLVRIIQDIELEVRARVNKELAEAKRSRHSHDKDKKKKSSSGSSNISDLYDEVEQSPVGLRKVLPSASAASVSFGSTSSSSSSSSNGRSRSHSSADHGHHMHHNHR